MSCATCGGIDSNTKLQKLPESSKVAGPGNFRFKNKSRRPDLFSRQLLNFWPYPNIIQKIAERYKTYIRQMGDTKRKINPRKVPIVSNGLSWECRRHVGRHVATRDNVAKFCRHDCVADIVFLPIWLFPPLLMSGNADIS